MENISDLSIERILSRAKIRRKSKNLINVIKGVVYQEFLTNFVLKVCLLARSFNRTTVIYKDIESVCKLGGINLVFIPEIELEMAQKNFKLIIKEIGENIRLQKGVSVVIQTITEDWIYRLGIGAKSASKHRGAKTVTEKDIKFVVESRPLIRL
jgi:histone H3/H4